VNWTSFRTLWITLCLGGALLVAGCTTTKGGDATPPEDEIVEVTLEAPTAPAGVSDAAMATRDAEIATLRAENQTLRTEVERVQAQNRALGLEAARLREEIVSRPLGTVNAPPVQDPPGGELVIGAPQPAPPQPASGQYAVQTASYSNTSKGKKAARSLCQFFEERGYAPTEARESGKYVMVLVGAFGSKAEARSARDEIIGLEYHGRKGDFASATVRQN
jgi:hypothetical protein